MATRRKPKAYKTGGGVIADSELPITVVPIEEPAEPIVPPASNESVDAVLRALEAQRNAERLQAAAAAQAAQQQQQQPQRQPQPSPHMSERRMAFIREHPDLADPQHQEAVMSYWRQGLRMGLREDTDELDNYVATGLRFERLHREPERREPQAAPIDPEPAQAGQEAFEAPRSERRSMPMTAPVSRSEAPTYSGKRTSSRGEMRLTEEERKIAVASIPDRPDAPRLTDAQKEYRYALNKAKYEQMKRDGSYSEQRERGATSSRIPTSRSRQRRGTCFSMSSACRISAIRPTCSRSPTSSSRSRGSSARRRRGACISRSLGIDNVSAKIPR